MKASSVIKARARHAARSDCIAYATPTCQDTIATAGRRKTGRLVVREMQQGLDTLDALNAEPAPSSFTYGRDFIYPNRD